MLSLRVWKFFWIIHGKAWLTGTIKKNRKLIANEEFHYIEPRHKTVFIDTMWKIGQAVRHSQYIEMEYVRSKDKSRVKRKVQPAAVMFSECYFSWLLL